MVRRTASWGFPEWFVVAQTVGPALLCLPGTQRFRVLLRMGVYVLSLLGLVLGMLRPRVTRGHPAWTLLVIAAVYMALMILHPTTNTTMAGLAQVGMHLAITAPIFWAPQYFLGDYRRLARLLTILWVFNGASAMVGILQVRDPGTWIPAEFANGVNVYRGGGGLVYRGGGGRKVIRPPGLSDSPGGACIPGMIVASMALAYLGLPVSRVRKILGLVVGMAGVTVVFLTHIRSALVVIIGSAVFYLVILVKQNRAGTVLILAGSIAACGVGSLRYASSLGGRSTTDRFATLVEADPLTVYERSARLGMITNTFDTLIVDYPLGAGLGRWGMMRAYFGNENNPDSPKIWAEVQFPAWALDGGIVLLSLYPIALVVAFHRLLQLSLRHHSYLLRQWGGMVVMLSVSPIALMFDCTPFNSQTGIQFWLLIGAFEGVAQGDTLPRTFLHSRGGSDTRV